MDIKNFPPNVMSDIKLTDEQIRELNESILQGNTWSKVLFKLGDESSAEPEITPKHETPCSDTPNQHAE
jgi:hypothetical protein